MKLITTLLSGALLCGLGLCAEDPACTPLPGDFIFGEPVPMVPADIPPGCSDYEVLVARGTSEPNFDEGGKFGVIVGDPIVSNLTEALPGVQGYPVQYPADINFVDNMVIGGNDIVSRIQAQDVMCPNQLFALVGYSQGAGVVHKALELLPSNLQSKVRSVSVFGDPSKGLNDGDIWPSDWPYGFESKIHDVCAVGDPICDASQTCLYWHLTYIRPFYIDTAVDFIVEKFVNNFNVLPIQSDDDSSV